MENIDLSSVAIKCSSRSEAESAIQFFIDCGYKISVIWRDVHDLTNEWYKYRYVALIKDQTYVTMFSHIDESNYKSVFSYSEFFSNHVECADYDMIL